MNKKALAILIAISLAGVYGCHEKNTNDTNKCEHSSYCNGNISVFCQGGTEQTQICGELGCNQATGICNTSTTPQTHEPENTCGQERCNGDISIFCVNGKEETQNCGNAGCNPATGHCNSTTGQEKCTQNYCNGNISIFCLNGNSMLQNCADAGCNQATGLCNSAQRVEEQTHKCTKNQCAGSISNMCVNDTNYIVDCGTAGCNAMTGLCNSPSATTPTQCTTHSCSGSIANICVNGTILLKECGSAGCDPNTGLCNQTTSQTQCTTNTCIGSVANLCIGGINTPVACGVLGCDPTTGTCRTETQDPGSSSTPECTADSCSGNFINFCVDGKVVSRDCGTLGCDATNKKCNTDSSAVVECSASKCVGNVANICRQGTLIEVDCGALGCNSNTAMCNTEIPDVPGALTYGGNVGDACDTVNYKQSCINDGLAALYCDNGTVKQLFCSSCNDAGYDPTKPLQVYCKDASNNNSSLTEGGNVGDSCSRTNYKSTCINNGQNALVCWNSEVTQWDCASCQDAGYNPDKPLEINCVKLTPQVTEGGSLGSACEQDYYKQTCINGGANALVCSSQNTVTQWDCEGVCTSAGYDPNHPLWVNCPAPTPQGCVTSDGQPGVDCCDKNTYQVSCKDGNAHALVCAQGMVKQWDCAGSICSVEDNIVNCPKPEATCVSTGGNPGDCCDVNLYENTCISDGANALICRNGKVKQWTCADNHCAVTNNEVDCPMPDNPDPSCVSTGGDVGACCKSSTYIPTCIDENAHALICAQGKVKMWDCADNICVVDSDRNLYCPKDSVICPTIGGNDGDCCDVNEYTISCDETTAYACFGGFVYVSECPADTMHCDASIGMCVVNSPTVCVNEGGTPGVDCCVKDDYQVSCTDGGAHALICAQGMVKQWDCANNQCSVENNTVNCPNPNCVTTGGTPGEDCCDKNTYQVSCINGNANALICANGKVKEWNCANNVCSIADNTVNCPEPQNPECVTTGGNVGDCCQKAYYQSSCINGGQNALYCSGGVIKQKNCSEGTTCTITDNYVTCE